jgi:hypothetical protein
MLFSFCHGVAMYVHIVVSCSFSKQVWWSVLVALGHLQGLPNLDTIFDWVGRLEINVDTIFALVAWELWKEMNARCFCSVATQLHQLLVVIKHKAEQCQHKTLGLSPVRYNSLSTLISREGLSLIVICYSPAFFSRIRTSVHIILIEEESL